MGSTISDFFSGVGGIKDKIGDAFESIGNGINALVVTADVGIATAGSVAALWAVSNAYYQIKLARK